jgi:hypothetical protein
VIRLMSLSTFLMLTSNMVHAQPPAAGRQAMVALYAAVGPELKTYILDVGAARLLEQGSVTLPQNVQEAWPHPSRRYLYVTWSNNMGGKAGQHGVTSFRINPANGALQPVWRLPAGPAEEQRPCGGPCCEMHRSIYADAEADSSTPDDAFPQANSW